MIAELFIWNLDTETPWAKHTREGETNGIQHILVKLAWSSWNICWMADETLCS